MLQIIQEVQDGLLALSSLRAQAKHGSDGEKHLVQRVYALSCCFACFGPVDGGTNRQEELRDPS